MPDLWLRISLVSHSWQEAFFGYRMHDLLQDKKSNLKHFSQLLVTWQREECSIDYLMIGLVLWLFSGGILVVLKWRFFGFLLDLGGGFLFVFWFFMLAAVIRWKCFLYKSITNAINLNCQFLGKLVQRRFLFKFDQ